MDRLRVRCELKMEELLLCQIEKVEERNELEIL
jgi:hypothetical protein